MEPVSGPLSQASFVYIPPVFKPDRLTEIYGSQQDDYLKRSLDNIKYGVSLVKDGWHNQEELEKIFFVLLDVFGKSRAKIAKDHGSQNAKLFGNRRDINSKNEIHCFFMDATYESYNAPILSFLLNKMKLLQNSNALTCNKKIVSKDAYQGVKTSFEIEVLDCNELKNRKWDQLTLDEILTFPCSSALKALYIRESLEDLCDTELAVKVREMRKFKNEHPELYKRKNMTIAIKLLEEAYLEAGEFQKLVFATARLTIDEKHYATTQYVTWGIENPLIDPLSLMKKNCKVMVVNQDIYLVEVLLKDIAKIFKETILWDKQDLTMLKNKVAMFRFKFAHAMPFERGSAAISEWFEHLIYVFHGIQCKYKNGGSIDLAAYANPFFSDFFKIYDSMVELQTTHVV